MKKELNWIQAQIERQEIARLREKAVALNKKLKIS
jgi:hypothetical protein